MLVRIGSLAMALAPAGAFLAPHSRPGVIGAGSPALRHAAPPHRSISSPVHRPRPARGAGAGAAMQAEGIVLAAGVVDAMQAQLSALTLDDIAGGLFAISLFPYLGFLYHLGRPENKTPELGLFGFKFLLAFVAASIPAAIAAKVLYGAQLADVDYLHGGAESFLALTNLFIVLGFRRAVAGSPVQDSQTHFVYCFYTAKYTRALTCANVSMSQCLPGLQGPASPGDAVQPCRHGWCAGRSALPRSAGPVRGYAGPRRGTRGTRQRPVFPDVHLPGKVARPACTLHVRLTKKEAAGVWGPAGGWCTRVL
jgi:hypothetical protein